jgi:hypothetical protein
LGAREKLNRVHAIGSLGVAALLGLASGSVAIFVLAGVVMIGVSVYSGEIRGKGGGR